MIRLCPTNISWKMPFGKIWHNQPLVIYHYHYQPQHVYHYHYQPQHIYHYHYQPQHVYHYSIRFEKKVYYGKYGFRYKIDGELIVFFNLDFYVFEFKNGGY